MKRFKPILRWQPVYSWISGLTAILIIAYCFKLLTFFEALQILITFTLVFITAQYAISTQRMVEEMKLTREAQTKPAIIAYFDNPQSVLLDLVIKNIGYGAARDVRLKIMPLLYDHRERDISELSLFKKGIAFFPPNREFRQIIGTTLQYFKEGSTRSLDYELTISYRNAEGKEMPPYIVTLDLAVYRDLPIARESDMDRLTKEVKNLADKLRK
jgi:hypothetical protein